jgi:hypothetical protein
VLAATEASCSDAPLPADAATPCNNPTDSVCAATRAATRATKAAIASVRARRSANSANSLVYARNVPTSLSTTRQTYEKGG